MLAPNPDPTVASVFAPRTAIEPDGTVTGYASLFGAIDQARDMVVRGAFADTLRLRGPRRVPMLFQHDPSEPVGVWLELREDHRGLYARGRLIPEVARGRELLSLLRAGAIDGLSIGFRTVKARKEAAGGVRRILEADLWEISVVTFPMLPGARVERVKGFGARQALPTIREFERWLTRDAGLTRGDARAVITRGFASLMRERDAAPNDPSALARKIRRAASLFQ